jgi:Regulator of chromosome condensation (RCC1) repeat
VHKRVLSIAVLAASVSALVACSSSSSSGEGAKDGGTSSSSSGGSESDGGSGSGSSSGSSGGSSGSSGGSSGSGSGSGNKAGSGSGCIFFGDAGQPTAVAASAVSVGSSVGCALTASGGVECWGFLSCFETSLSGGLATGCPAELCSGSDPLLGNDPSTYVPTPITGLTSGATALSVSEGNTACALTPNGGVQCWGSSGVGQVLLGSDFDGGASRAPVQITGLISPVTAVSVGGGSALGRVCALTSVGGVVCWGDDGMFDSAVPVQIEGLTSGVTAISVGGNSACAITSGGGVRCWGNNDEGELGDGTTTSSEVPVQVQGLTSGVTSVSVGTSGACAVTAGGGVVCWGVLSSGVTTSPPTSGVTAISVGNSSACAITSGGGVVCWGDDSQGQLGDGTTASSGAAPVQVSGLTSGVTAISVGYNTACAVTSGGGVVCWGFVSPVPIPIVGF